MTTPHDDGAVIASISTSSVAERAGIKQHDYRYIFIGQLVTTAADIVDAMNTVKIGDTIKARAIRVDSNAGLFHERILALRL